MGGTTVRFLSLGLGRIRQKAVLLIVILSLALLTGLAGTVIATAYFSQDDFKLSIGLVVEDDNSTMGQLAQLMLSSQAIRKNYHIVQLEDRDTGISQVEEGVLYACIVLPQDFLYSLQTGQNYPPLVILNSTQTADAQLTAALMDVLTEMMRLSQSGIYSATDWVLAESALDSSFYLDSNLAYLTYVADRSETFFSSLIPYEQTLDLTSHYGLTLGIFFLLLSSALFYPCFNIAEDFQMMKRLRTLSNYHHGLYFSQLTALFFLYFLLLGGLMMGLGGQISPLSTLSLVSATALFVLFQALLFQLVPHYLPAILLSLSLHGLSLFAAGGILPTLLLPQYWTTVAKLFPLYHIRTLLSSGLVSIGRLPLLNLIILVFCWLLVSLLIHWNDKILSERGYYHGIS